jgi:major intracellular serine protease
VKSIHETVSESPYGKKRLLPFTVDEVNDAATHIPYGIKQMKAPDLWAEGEKGEGVVICILDTGISKHPDLDDRVIDGRNFTNEGSASDYTDRNGHGTHVAGIIAASENGTGIVGIAPKASLLIGKVLNKNGSGDYKGITDGIRWATKWRGKNGERVRVINMSLGGAYNDREQYKAILEACAAGILVVVASGNEGDANEESFEYSYPAVHRECITVAACDSEAKLAFFSNNSKEVDIIAAGVDVLSTYPTGRYAVLSGTSMATPHVSGALALIINQSEKTFRRTLSESELYANLVQCCCSLGYKASSEGHGLPDLTKLNNKCTD